MPLFDLPHDRLTEYRPRDTTPADFDAFWEESLRQARRHPISLELTPAEEGLRTTEVWDVRFAGWNGEPIAAWYLRPAGVTEPLPLVIQYNGYGGGRGLPVQHLVPSAGGFAHLVVDNRGQGAGGNVGVTPDPDPDPRTGQHPGFMTRGITSPHSYYYRRLIVDAVRALDAGSSLPGVQRDRIAVTGRSQGGGLALAVAALGDGVHTVAAAVPFLSHFDRAIRITDKPPYAEIARYLKIRRDDEAVVLSTLAYFDAVSFAARASAPALFSVALMDDVCPPSTVYAAYNRYAGDKEMRVWNFNGHEGGEAFEHRELLDFLERRFGRGKTAERKEQER